MGLYLVTMINEGEVPGDYREVSAENLKHTWRPQVRIDATSSYGLGCIMMDYYGFTLLHHRKGLGTR